MYMRRDRSICEFTNNKHSSDETTFHIRVGYIKFSYTQKKKKKKEKTDQFCRGQNYISESIIDYCEIPPTLQQMSELQFITITINPLRSDIRLCGSHIEQTQLCLIQLRKKYLDLPLNKVLLTRAFYHLVKFCLEYVPTPRANCGGSMHRKMSA